MFKVLGARKRLPGSKGEVQPGRQMMKTGGWPNECGSSLNTTPIVTPHKNARNKKNRSLRFFCLATIGSLGVLWMPPLSLVVQGLLDDRLMPLGPGLPDASARQRLLELSPAALFAAPIQDMDAARACLAGLWLWHDCLDESHSLSQDLATAEGSWWHGIMHRREPDYGNSKYWFRRVGQHPAFATLSQKLGVAIWDPFAFVDRCERAARNGGAEEQTCREIQREEWRVLFDYCAERAG